MRKTTELMDTGKGGMQMVCVQKLTLYKSWTQLKEGNTHLSHANTQFNSLQITYLLEIIKIKTHCIGKELNTLSFQKPF